MYTHTDQTMYVKGNYVPWRLSDFMLSSLPFMKVIHHADRSSECDLGGRSVMQTWQDMVISV